MKRPARRLFPVWANFILEIIVDRLLREFKVQANVGSPRVAYRETITQSVTAEGKFVRQSGGRGQFGHVVMEFEPLHDGTEFKFEDKVVGGTVPREYIQLGRAWCQGCHVVGCRCRLSGGGYSWRGWLTVRIMKLIRPISRSRLRVRWRSRRLVAKPSRFCLSQSWRLKLCFRMSILAT